MCRIIAVDLDGTLLSPNNQITEYTKATIKLLVEKGFYFILASGRHYIDVIKIQQFLQIKSFMITSNGARVYDLNNKLIFDNDLDVNIASKLGKIKYLDTDIITQIHRKNKWYVNSNRTDNKFCTDFSCLQYQYFHPDLFDFENISKIFFTSTKHKKLYNLKKHITNLWSPRVNVNFSSPDCLEVISGSTSKGHGLKIISILLGISLDKFISFGDGMNDQDMLSMSGQSYIMENADNRLKRILPNVKIIASNKHDGVASFLDNMFLRNI